MREGAPRTGARRSATPPQASSAIRPAQPGRPRLGLALPSGSGTGLPFLVSLLSRPHAGTLSKISSRTTPGPSSRRSIGGSLSEIQPLHLPIPGAGEVHERKAVDARRVQPADRAVGQGDVADAPGVEASGGE